MYKTRLHNLLHLKERRRALRNHPTKAEAYLWKYLQGKQLSFKIRRQHSIGNYIVDFYCPSAQLIIEIDGGIHAHPVQRILDEERQDQLEAWGFRVIRFWNKDVFENTEGVLDEIRHHLNLP